MYLQGAASGPQTRSGALAFRLQVSKRLRSKPKNIAITRAKRRQTLAFTRIFTLPQDLAPEPPAFLSSPLSTTTLRKHLSEPSPRPLNRRLSNTHATGSAGAGSLPLLPCLHHTIGVAKLKLPSPTTRSALASPRDALHRTAVLQCFAGH